MKIYRATLEDCGNYSGTVVVIDVIRAFTTATIAFSRGASEINLVSEVSEALQLRDSIPGSKVMGEVGGAKPPKFELSNSPSELALVNLKGIKLIQRTTAGTQGVVRSKRADRLIAGTFTNAKATARYLQLLELSEVTFVITGNILGGDGAEDFAYADYMEELLSGKDPSLESYKLAVQNSSWGRCILDPGRLEFPEADLDFVLDFNKFDFVLPIQRRDDQLVMTSLEGF